MGQNRVKGYFLESGVVLDSFSSGTILIDVIRTNQFRILIKSQTLMPNLSLK